MEENEIAGIDTIRGLVGSPPMELTISRESVKHGTALMEDWNSSHLAFIPYCFICKVPVNWCSPPKGFIFRCPSCGRKWRTK